MGKAQEVWMFDNEIDWVTCRYAFLFAARRARGNARYLYVTYKAEQLHSRTRIAAKANVRKQEVSLEIFF